MALLAALCGAVTLARARPSAAMLTVAVRVRPETMQRIAALEKAADRAPAQDAERAWFDLGRTALEYVGAEQSTSGEQRTILHALEQSCVHLPAASLAALGALGGHPIISREFARRLLEEARDKHARWAAWAKPEAAAEVRDALARFGPSAYETLKNEWRESGAAAWARGGATRSVFQIAILTTSPEDSADAASNFQSGVRAALADHFPGWDDQFILRVVRSQSDPAWMSWVSTCCGMEYAGIVVALDGLQLVTSTMSAARVGHILAVDARSAQSIPTGSDAQQALGSVPPESLPLIRGSSPFHGANLDYSSLVVGGASKDSGFFRMDPIVLRPPTSEPVRRLALALRDRSEIRRITIVVPDVGGDETLADVFLGAIREINREAVVLRYESGRRDRGADVKAWQATGAQAICFAGPADEASDWLSAIQRARLRPVIFATTDLDPAGFHAPLRPALEGAVLVGTDWAVSDSTLARTIDAAVGRAHPSDSLAYGRGYLFGRQVSQALEHGAYTLGRMHAELAGQFPRFSWSTANHSSGSYLGRDRLPTEVEVPLFIVEHGEMRSLSRP